MLDMPNLLLIHIFWNSIIKDVSKGGFNLGHPGGCQSANVAKKVFTNITVNQRIRSNFRFIFFANGELCLAKFPKRPTTT